jgi:hypothetical protein
VREINVLGFIFSEEKLFYLIQLGYMCIKMKVRAGVQGRKDSESEP